MLTKVANHTHTLHACLFAMMSLQSTTLVSTISETTTAATVVAVIHRAPKIQASNAKTASTAMITSRREIRPIPPNSVAAHSATSSPFFTSVG